MSSARPVTVTVPDAENTWLEGLVQLAVQFWVDVLLVDAGTAGKLWL
jgi:hypothetical protein